LPYLLDCREGLAIDGVLDGNQKQQALTAPDFAQIESPGGLHFHQSSHAELAAGRAGRQLHAEHSAAETVLGPWLRLAVRQPSNCDLPIRLRHETKLY
jgi:hypothetical protein